MYMKANYKDTLALSKISWTEGGLNGMFSTVMIILEVVDIFWVKN